MDCSGRGRSHGLVSCRLGTACSGNRRSNDRNIGRWLLVGRKALVALVLAVEEAHCLLLWWLEPSHLAPDHFSCLLRNEADGKADTSEQSGPHEPVVKLIRIVHRVPITSETAANGNYCAGVPNPPHTVSTMNFDALSKSSGSAGIRSKIQPVRTCSVAP